MAGQRNADQAAVAEEVVAALEGGPGRAQLGDRQVFGEGRAGGEARGQEAGQETAAHGGEAAQAAEGFQLLAQEEEAGARQVAQPGDVVAVQVRDQHQLDLVGRDAEAAAAGFRAFRAGRRRGGVAIR